MMTRASVMARVWLRNVGEGSVRRRRAGGSKWLVLLGLVVGGVVRLGGVVCVWGSAVCLQFILRTCTSLILGMFRKRYIILHAPLSAPCPC